MRGKLPWRQSEENPRVIIDAEGSICGMMDKADLSAAVVAAVNWATPTLFGEHLPEWATGGQR